MKIHLRSLLSRSSTLASSLTLVSSVILASHLAHAQIVDLEGGSPPPIGQDPSEMPPPPVPPILRDQSLAEPIPPLPIPNEPPSNLTGDPLDLTNPDNWSPTPKITPQVLSQACSLSMRGNTELRFGEPLFRSSAFDLKLRIQAKIAENTYRVVALTIAGADNSVIENDMGSGTCTIDPFGREVLNLRFSKRGKFQLVSDSSLEQVPPRSLTFSGLADSSIGQRAIRLRAQ